MKESDLQQQIIGYLSAMSRKYNFIFFAPMNESVMMVLRRFKVPQKTVSMILSWMKKMGFLPGVSDIIIMHNGKAYFLELKTATGKQLKSQVIFMNNSRKTNIEYEIARSLDDCKRLLRIWNVVKD